MIFAQILDSVIANTIVLDDESLVPLFSEGFDLLLEIDQLSPMPSVGWFYDTVSTNFFPPATLALVQSNVVVQVIQNCDAFITNEAANYQYIIDITTVNPQPQVGWAYNGTTFIPNAAYYQQLISEAITFGNTLIVQFAAANVALGVTQSGMTSAVIAYTSNLFLAISIGSMYQAVSIINAMIADTSSTKVGAYATGTASSQLSGTITFTAETLGIVGNSVNLTFNGSQEVGTVVTAWNTANPNNQVSYSSASTAVPESSGVTLSGGVNTLAPFITNDVLYSYLNQIQTWLEIPLTTNPGP